MHRRYCQISYSYPENFRIYIDFFHTAWNDRCAAENVQDKADFMDHKCLYTYYARYAVNASDHYDILRYTYA